MLLFFCEVVLVCRPCIAGADEKVWAEKVFGRSWVLYDGLGFFEESRDKISLGEIPLHLLTHLSVSSDRENHIKIRFHFVINIESNKSFFIFFPADVWHGWSLYQFRAEGQAIAKRRLYFSSREK